MIDVKQRRRSEESEDLISFLSKINITIEITAYE